MKSISISLFMMMATCCTGQTNTNETISNFKKLEWLVGTWNRTDISKSEKSSYERWEKSGENKLRGYEATVQGKDTTLLEKVTILIKDNNIYYVADVPENTQPVYFKLTSITNTSFTCENPEHDFPKIISYKVEGVNLKAQISGNGKSIGYFFKRQ